MSATVVKLQYMGADGFPSQANPSQARFHRTANKIGYVLFSGGVGSGKTTAGAFEANRLFWENEGRDGYIVAHDWNTLENVVLPAFFSYLPAFAVLNHNKRANRIDCIGGRTIFLGSAKNPASLEAKNVTWGWGDEPRYWPLASYQKWIARKRIKGPRSAYVLSSTPAMGWMFEEFCTGKDNRGIIYCHTQENAHNLSDGYLQDLGTSYDKRLYDTYVGGQFAHLTGGVFDGFDATPGGKHCHSKLYAPGLPVCAFIDFGIVAPSVLYAQFFGHCARHGVDNCIHIIAEDMPNQCPTDRLAPLIKARYEAEEWHLADAFCDPAGRARSQETGITSIHIMKSYGIRCRYTTAAQATYIPNGIARINAKLDPYSGSASLYFDEDLLHTRGRGICNALRHSQFKTDSAGNATSDQPVKEGYYEHARDALRYGIMNLDPPKTRKPRAY